MICFRWITHNCGLLQKALYHDIWIRWWAKKKTMNNPNIVILVRFRNPPKNNTKMKEKKWIQMWNSGALRKLNVKSCDVYETDEICMCLIWLNEVPRFLRYWSDSPGQPNDWMFVFLFDFQFVCWSNWTSVHCLI